jgi:DNA-binding MarR family transcriptional regulator
MSLAIDEEQACAKSRLAAHRLISMQLRLMELWREVAGGHEEALLLMAIVAITGDRLTRINGSPELRNMAHPVPRTLLGRCNVSSLATATGLNRETARRVINRLIERGILERSADRSINFTAGRMQGDNAYHISEMQLDEFVRTANALMRDRVLTLQPQLPKA